MKAMQLVGVRQMEMREVADAKIKLDSDVLIRVRAVGVCGSDMHYYTSGRIGCQVVEYPFAVGHEGAGEVVEVGKAVRRVSVGDRIAIEPAMPCWECDQCKAGRHHTCRYLKFLGCPGQSEGCLSEFIVMPETSCFKIVDSMSMADAVISEPFAIGVYAVKLSGVASGAKVGVLGSGPIGMSVLLAAKNYGAEKVYVTDQLDVRLQYAKKAGADWVGNVDCEDVVRDIYSHEGGGLDVVFECCGEQSALDQAIKLLRPGGKLMIVGIPEFDRFSFAVDDMRRKEICVQNIRRQCDCVDEALELIGSRKVSVGFMATHRFKFEQAKEAFDLVADYKDGVLKAIVEF